MEFLPAAPREVRITRLREGLADLAFLDIASLVDAVAADPGLGARCVSVLTRRTPMAAHHVVGRPAAGRPLASPADLLRARYGGEAGSRFIAEHRALLRRLGGDTGDDPALHVEMPYGEIFGALAAGEIDVAPDFAGLLPRYRRAAGTGRPVGVLRHSDAGVVAYGTGFVASAAGLEARSGAIAAFVAVLRATYQRMAADPQGVATAARAALPDLDVEYAVAEWGEEERQAVFGNRGGGQREGMRGPGGEGDAAAGREDVSRAGGRGADTSGPGRRGGEPSSGSRADRPGWRPLDAGDPGGWAATVGWRREVWAVTHPSQAASDPPEPGLLATSLRA